MSARVAGLLTALLLGAAGGVVVSAGAASAAACPAGTGVTVVVGSSVSCDRNGGGSAASNVTDAGHSLKYASRQPGFVCRVDGSPSSDPCVNASPADAYWGLFWSDGKSGRWVYSTTGVGSLKVPAGGWVGFRFQTSSSRVSPGVRPYTAPPAPKPTPRPVTKAPPASSATKPSPTASSKTPAPSTSKSPSATPTAGASAAPSGAPTSGDPTGAEAGDEALRQTSQESDSSTSTLWVGALLALALLTGTGFTIWQRRARRS